MDLEWVPGKPQKLRRGWFPVVHRELRRQWRVYGRAPRVMRLHLDESGKVVSVEAVRA